MCSFFLYIYKSGCDLEGMGGQLIIKWIHAFFLLEQRGSDLRKVKNKLRTIEDLLQMQI